MREREREIDRKRERDTRTHRKIERLREWDTEQSIEYRNEEREVKGKNKCRENDESRSKQYICLI